IIFHHIAAVFELENGAIELALVATGIEIYLMANKRNVDRAGQLHGLGSLVYQCNKMSVEHLGKYAQHLCIIAGNAYFYGGLEITGTIRTACIASKLAPTWRKFILMKPLTSLAHNITFYPAI